MADGGGKAQVKLKIDKTLAASIALHVLVLGGGLVSFSSKAFEMAPEESVAVDGVSADQRAPVMAEVRGKAGDEKAGSTEGRREAERRTEADREEARSAQGRSDRGSHQKGREEAAAEAGPGG